MDITLKSLSGKLGIVCLAVVSIVALAVLSGCASSGVTQSQSHATQERIPRPDLIIVYDFAATPADVDATAWITGRYSQRETPQTAEEVQLGRQLGALVADRLVREISAMGMPAQRAGSGPQARIGDVLITGQLVTIDEGSRAGRVLIGFGKGSGELRTHVEGYRVEQGGHRLLGSREIKAEGGKQPDMIVPAIGAVAMSSPVGLVVGGVMAVTKESGPETIQAAANRTAEEIAKELRVAFRREGWI